MADMIPAIIRVASRKVGKNDWLYATAKDDFGANTNKCNQFVYDVMVEAGLVPKPTVPKYVLWTRPPTAGEWATPSVAIAGWVVVTDPKPGDVVAEAHNYADATGHVGIVIGEKMTASASALAKGQIVQNDWGFRTDSKPTFRRFKG